MLRQILTLFVLAIALDSSLARVCFNGRCYEGTHPSLRPKVCRGPHQHWSRYGGCDRTCKDLDGLAPCSTVALGKCLCNDGYVRKYEDGTGPCIPPHRCPHRCPKHQHWSRNVGCEKTCFDLNGSRACSLLLRAGCKCNRGFVRKFRDGTGPCIPPSQCHHHRCPKHEHWTRDKGCEKTCGNLGGNRNCPLILTSGCACNKHFVRKHPDGTGPCIPPSQCHHHRCPKHEHWTRDKGCEKTCGNLGGNRNCPLILTSGCACNKHFVRKHPDGTGPCIPPSQCPHHRCPKHEHWTRDKGCEKTCGNLGGNRNCPLILTAGCKCNNHFVRRYSDGTGPCIPPSQCPRCPGRHERWDKCRGRCQPTCGHRYPMCDLMCSPGCVCKDGFVRRGNNDPCIRKRDCPN
ncbi:neuropeptide GPCR A44 [Sarcoptes scabiei]|nr:neuropeptide GPCR A44 [Sarcoptes scabiei]